MSAGNLLGDRISLHCFRCREPRDFERILASRPVFACAGCGNTKEIEELGRVKILGRVSPLPPQRIVEEGAGPVLGRISYTNRRREERMSTDETKFKRSPLQSAIDVSVKEQLKGVRADIDELRREIKELGKGDGDRDIERKLDEKLEREIPELVTRAVTQMLATPAKRGAGKKEQAEDGACRHKNFMKKCPGCQARRAEQDASAEPES